MSQGVLNGHAKKPKESLLSLAVLYQNAKKTPTRFTLEAIPEDAQLLYANHSDVPIQSYALLGTYLLS